MGASESLSRAREQCDSLINSMKSKHEQQTLSLKEKMDEINAQLKEQVNLYYFYISGIHIHVL